MYIICGLIIRPQIILGKYLISQGNNNNFQLDWDNRITDISFPFIAPTSGIVVVDYVFWPNYIKGSFGGIKINNMTVAFSYHDDVESGLENILPIMISKNDILTSFGNGNWKANILYFVPFK